MCGIQVGVAKRLDIESLSKEISELVEILDKEIENDTVCVNVERVKRVTKGLEQIISSDP